MTVTAYSINVCNFIQSKLTKLDQVIKRDLRKNNMLGRQASNERLYIKEVYEDTRLRVGYHMFVPDHR